MKAWKIAAVVSVSVWAAGQNAQSASAPENQFYRIGTMIHCNTPLPAGKNPTPASYTPCLRTGAIGIGDEVKAIEGHLGPAVEEPREIKGRELRLYSYDRNKPESFIVVGYEDGKAVTIQVVGPQTAGKHPVAGVEIGDPIATIVKTVGNPSNQRCNVIIHQEIWSYEPFPIYLHMNEGMLVGFRLANAPEFEGPFEPLKSVFREPC